MSAWQIPLSVKQPQITPPAVAALQVSNLQNSQLEQQQRQQSIESGEADLELKRQQMKDDQTMRQALFDSGGDMAKFQQAIVGKISPQRMFQTNQALVAQQKGLSDAEESRIKVAQAHHDRLAGLADSVLAATTPESKDAAWAQGLQAAYGEGLVPPGSLPATRPDDQTVTILRNGNLLNSQAVKQENERRMADAAAMRANAQAQQAKTQAQLREETVLRNQTAETASHLASIANYDDAEAALDKLQPQIAEKFQSLFPLDRANWDPVKWHQAVLGVGMSPQQIEAGEDRRSVQQDREQARQDADANRKAMIGIAQGNLDLRRDVADQKAGSASGGVKPLTAGQRLVEERSISNNEYGTPNRPGLHNLRKSYGAQLTAKKDTKGNALYDSDGNLTDAGRETQSKYDAATDSLQNTQYRKADLYGIGKPDPEDVKLAKDGDEIQALDGSAWKKQDGVVYYRGTGSSAPKPAQPAVAPPAPTRQPAAPPVPAAKPQQPPPAAAPQKMSEQQARQKATAAGKDPDWYVNALKQRGLLQ